MLVVDVLVDLCGCFFIIVVELVVCGEGGCGEVYGDVVGSLVLYFFCYLLCVCGIGEVVL